MSRHDLAQYLAARDVFDALVEVVKGALVHEREMQNPRGEPYTWLDVTVQIKPGDTARYMPSFVGAALQTGGELNFGIYGDTTWQLRVWVSGPAGAARKANAENGKDDKP